MTQSVSVVLNGYKRPETLGLQLTALKEQSVKVNEVLFWKNSPQNRFFQPRFKKSLTKEILMSSNNHNFGVWGRLSFALMAQSKFVLVLDDDTIPGSRWLENCFDNFREQPGLYGTIGIRFNSALGYDGFQEKIGWDNPNQFREKVDIIGHSWFFPKDYLSFFWREIPNPIPRFVGEDIHFSYTLQKYAGISSFVPPHPANSPDFWGSDPDLARKFGGDNHATANHALPAMNEYLQKCTTLGFKLMKGSHDAE
jgi:hypothetical protein